MIFFPERIRLGFFFLEIGFLMNRINLYFYKVNVCFVVQIYIVLQNFRNAANNRPLDRWSVTTKMARKDPYIYN